MASFLCSRGSKTLSKENLSDVDPCKSKATERDRSKELKGRSPHRIQCSPGVKSIIPEVNSDLAWMGSLTVVLKRGRQGYGFAVTGSSPAIISRVQEGMPAEEAGLQRGDCIVKINGQNVSRSMADSVAKIIRQSDKQIIVDIQRPDLSGELSPPRPILAPIIEQEELLPNAPCDKDNLRPDPNAASSSPEVSFCQSSPEQFMSISPRHLSPSSLQISPEGSADDSLRELLGAGCCFSESDNQDVKSSMNPINLSFQSLGTQEQERQAAISKLKSLESEFVEVMQAGMERFSRPLRQYIISPSEHATLFQNVEKLVAYSECHLRCLNEHSLQYSDSDDCPESERFTEVVGAVFKPRLELLSEAYEEYCNGLKNSFRLLMELHEDAEFSRFLKQPPLEPGEPSISQFLQRPLQHIKDMVLTLQKIAINTSMEHYDYVEMKAVIERLRNACNRINESNTRRSRISLTSVTPSTKSKVSHRSKAHSRVSDQSRASEPSCDHASVSSNQSMMSIASVDNEVMDIQSRLLFPDHMPAFQLATATRHMIYSGDLLLFDGLLWNRVFVVLMSDLMLVTRPDHGQYLAVAQEPIILHTIDFLNVDRMQLCEFSVIMSPAHGEGHMIFQAPTPELKSTWTHVLSQRICASKAQLILDNSVDNIV